MGDRLIIKMGYISVFVTDLRASREMATSILGLRETGQETGKIALSAAPVPCEMIYTESEVDAVDHIGLVAAGPEALEEIRRRVERGGFDIADDVPTVIGSSAGFTFYGPEEFMFSVYLDPEAARVPEMRHFGRGVDKFGHVNLHPRDIEGMRRFLVDLLDFRVSDIIGDGLAYFLRCNSDHHGIALIAGRGVLHHHAWQAQSIADLAAVGDRLDGAGRRLLWGPVRHGAGHNIAAYYVEPAGSVIEVYCDLEQIHDDNRPPGVWANDMSWVNRWTDERVENFRSFGIGPAPREVHRNQRG